MLKFDMSGKTHIIDSKNKVFADTSYSDKGFTITVLPITRTQYAEIQKRLTTYKKGVPVTDDMAVDAEVFCKTVKDWDGILDGEGDAIECNPEMRAKIADVFWGFAGIVNRAMLTCLEQKESNEAQDEKN